VPVFGSQSVHLPVWVDL